MEGDNSERHARTLLLLFYYGCNILINQITQKEVDISFIKPTSYLSIFRI